MICIPEGFRLEPFSPSHCPEAEAIETLCFSDPWPGIAIETLLCPGEGHFGIACVRIADGRLAAYGGVQYALDQGDVTNIATAPEFRRIGCARAVLCGLEEKSLASGIKELFLEVRRSNRGAATLYESSGYKYYGIRKNYYDKPREDALLMVKQLTAGR